MTEDRILVINPNSTVAVTQGPATTRAATGRGLRRLSTAIGFT